VLELSSTRREDRLQQFVRTLHTSVELDDVQTLPLPLSAVSQSVTFCCMTGSGS
jgi:hypothetical protein